MLNYDEIIKNLRQNSVKQVISEIDNKWMKYKITRYCKQWNDDYNNIKEKILSDEKFARFFIKDPKRKNVYEIETFKYLKYELKKNIYKLNNKGKNALHIQDGEIINGSSTISSTKTLDFKEIDGDNIIYYSHKYTESEGGAQDNQYRDIINFLDGAKMYVETHNDNISFIALIDGAYYERKNRKEILRGVYENKRILIRGINEL